MPAFTRENSGFLFVCYRDCTRDLYPLVQIERDSHLSPGFGQVFPLLALICSLIGAHCAVGFARISPRHVAEEPIALGKDKRPESFSLSAFRNVLRAVQDWSQTNPSKSRNDCFFGCQATVARKDARVSFAS